MSKAFQTFTEIEASLPSDRTIELEMELEAMKHRLISQGVSTLTSEQEAEDLRRALDENRKYADPKDVEAFFAKYR